MQYKLLKELPYKKIGEIITGAGYYDIGGICVPEKYLLDRPDFFQPIVEKKRYEDLKFRDAYWFIGANSIIIQGEFTKSIPRSETFLTREEAEDEHKRREYSVRPDRFIPEIGEEYFYPTQSGDSEKWTNQGYAGDYLVINSGLAFETREDCEKAIKEHDIVRLFYTLR